MGITSALMKHYLVLSNGTEMKENFPLWKKWFKQEGDKKVLATQLLDSQVKDEFKAMSLLLFLIPKFGLLPNRMCSWENDDWRYCDTTSVNSLHIETFSPQLLEFTVETLCTLSEYLTRMIEQNRKLTSEDIGGGNKHQILKKYNAISRKMLTLIPVEDPLAKKLFDHYLLNDPIPWDDGMIGEYSGYNEFSKLMLEEHIPMFWKVAADNSIRAIIEDEVASKSVPRKAWELGIACYIRHVEERFFEMNLYKYADELALSQLQYIADVVTRYPADYVEEWSDFGEMLGFLQSQAESGIPIAIALITANIRSPSFKIKYETDAIFYQYIINEYTLAEEDRLKVVQEIEREKFEREQLALKNIELQNKKTVVQSNILQSMC